MEVVVIGREGQCFVFGDAVEKSFDSGLGAGIARVPIGFDNRIGFSLHDELEKVKIETVGSAAVIAAPNGVLMGRFSYLRGGTEIELSVAPIDICINWFVVVDGVAIDGDSHSTLGFEKCGDVAIERIVVNRIIAPQDDDRGERMLCGKG